MGEVTENKPVGGVTWVCPRCGCEDDFVVRLGDLTDDLQPFLSVWLSLEPAQKLRVWLFIGDLIAEKKEAERSNNM